MGSALNAANVFPPVPGARGKSVSGRDRFAVFLREKPHVCAWKGREVIPDPAETAVGEEGSASNRKLFCTQ